MPEKTAGSTLRLRDGRSLGYAVYGDPNGKPGLYFHGFPGSRIQARIVDATAERLGFCIIALERPGVGLSDFKPGRAIIDWPDDVIQAADVMGIDRFVVLGPSAGAPYAMACAFKVPHRLTAVGIINGFGPLDVPSATDGMRRRERLFFASARRLPWLTSLAMWWLARQARRDPERLVLQMATGASDSDKEVLARPEVVEIFRDDVAEAFRRGSPGAARELLLYTRDWGFRLEDITIEIQLWQGEADVNVSPSMGRHLAGAIPNCRARFYPAEGHLLAVDRMEEIQADLFR